MQVDSTVLFPRTEPMVDHQNVTCILANEIAKLRSECAEVVQHKQQKSPKAVQQQTQQDTKATQPLHQRRSSQGRNHSGSVQEDASNGRRLAKMHQMEGGPVYRQNYQNSKATRTKGISGKSMPTL